MQEGFDAFRSVYNNVRPHESLNLDVPAVHYRPSATPYPEKLPAIVYKHGDEVRRVQDKGRISFKGHNCSVGRGFIGQPVAVRPTAIDGVWEVYYCEFKVGSINLRNSSK